VLDVQPFYYHASVCIAPLLSGSGTRLKILEAMSFGNPVVSTSIGAEGIDCVNGTHILIGNDSETFATHVLSLLRNKIQFDMIRTNALELVKATYDWNIIGKKINTKLNDLIKKQWQTL
jgi:glycosyltransferase involved in cell wall biosynthesis